MAQDGENILTRRLRKEQPLIVAEGFLMELERRGYNRHGSFVPTVVLDHPEKVEELTREFAHAGSEICQAFVYYAHEEKMRDLGRLDEFYLLNDRAHEIAKKVARETGTLFCSGLGTTNVYDPDDPESVTKCEQLLRKQVQMSAKHGVDYIAIETMWDYGEASIALKICKEFDLPAVVTLAPIDVGDGMLSTFDGYRMDDALLKLQSEGADCVGLNCARGPQTLIPLIRQLRSTIKGPLACVSTGYRTTPSQPTWYYLKHPDTDETSFPDDLYAHYLGQTDVKWYAEQLKEIGVEYVGFCCGNAPSYTRTLAITYGRNPPSAKYTSDFKEKNSVSRGKQSYTSERYSERLGKFIGLQA